MICPHCPADAKFEGYRSKRVQSLFGPVIDERAYYYCSACGQGWFPTDAEMGLTDRETPAARQVITLVGVLEPFAEAADRVLSKLTGINVSASTVQRQTEAMGTDVAERRARGEAIGPATAWDWHRDARDRTVAYVSLDATGVPQQGVHGEKAEGRMPWVAAVYNPSPPEQKRDRRLWQTRYVSGLMSLEQTGRELRVECQQVGIERADLVIALTDGGAGLEDCLIEHTLSGLAREEVLILDFFHAAEHVHDFAQTAFDLPTATTRAATWCHLLKHSGGAALQSEIEALDLSDRSAEVREAHRQLTGYLRNNQHRTDYPQYLANGWLIGSGVIESACKTLINHRLKGCGMRWRERGTTAVCQARSLYKSEPTLWNAYWSAPTAA